MLKYQRYNKENRHCRYQNPVLESKILRSQGYRNWNKNKKYLWKSSWKEANHLEWIVILHGNQNKTASRMLWGKIKDNIYVNLDYLHFESRKVHLLIVLVVDVRKGSLLWTSLNLRSFILSCIYMYCIIYICTHRTYCVIDYMSSYRGDFAKTDCSQKRIFRLNVKKIKKYAKPNHGIFLFSPWTGIYHGLVWHISLFSYFLV